MKVFVTGDSHAQMINRGLSLLREKNQEPADPELHVRLIGTARALRQPFYRVGNQRIRMVRRVFNAPAPHAKRIPPDSSYDAVVLSGLLTGGQIYRSVAMWSAYDFPGPLTGPSTGRRSVSEATMERILADDQRHLRELVDDIRRLGLTCVALDTPRPFRDTRAVRQIGAERVIAIDQLVRQRSEEFLAARDVPIARMPADCVDPDGFTNLSYKKSKEDPVHGNAELGARMVPELVSTLTSLEIPAPRPSESAAAGSA